VTKSTILFLAANPSGTDPLLLDEESRSIDQRIRSANERDSLELVTKWAVRPDDLLEYLNQYRPHIVHFSGHGTEREEIILLDESHRAIPVPAPALRQLFTAMKGNIRVVVLNACYSRPQAEAIVEVIDCAIGMKQEIGDQAAIAFAASFYRAIGYAHSVADAFEQGKTALMLAGIPEENTPTLHSRAGVDPAQVFLVEPKGDEEEVEQRGARLPLEREDRPEQGDEKVEKAVDEPVTSSRAPTLDEILPGTWEEQLQSPMGIAQARFELSANRQFRGQVQGPMGAMMIEGLWQADAFVPQFMLQGRKSDGFQVAPEMDVIRVTYFDQSQVVGVSIFGADAGRQVMWHRVGPPPDG